MRLKKADNLNNIDELLNKVKNSCQNIKDNYYVLLDNLNAIYIDYPNIYNEIKQIVKLPNDNNIKDVANMEKNMSDIIEKYLSNKDYLQSVIKKEEIQS